MGFCGFQGLGVSGFRKLRFTLSFEIVRVFYKRCRMVHPVFLEGSTLTDGESGDCG